MKLAFAFFMLLIGSLFVHADQPDSSVSRHWCVPDHIKVQFAGNIGLVSAGPGFNYLKNKMELDIMYGYVPASAGGTLHSLTMKNTWIPFKRINAGESMEIDILTAGIPLSYTFGKQFFFLAPRDQYPPRYYDYSSALRIGIFAGGRVSYILNNNSTFSKAGLYYEIGTYDLLLHNYIFNIHSMRFGNLFSLALGASIHLK